MNNTVKGPTKYVVKVNGATLQNGKDGLTFTGNDPALFYAQDGIISINITIPKVNSYWHVTIAAQERLAYNRYRGMTDNMTIIK